MLIAGSLKLASNTGSIESSSSFGKCARDHLDDGLKEQAQPSTGTNGLLIVIFAKKTLVFRVLVYILRDERASHDYFQLAVASIVESGRCQLAA